MKTLSVLLVMCLAFLATPLQAQQDTSSYFPLGLWGIWLNQDTLVSPYLPRSLTTLQWTREKVNFDSIKANYLVTWYPYNIFNTMMDYADTAGYRMDTHMGSYGSQIYEYGFPAKYTEYRFTCPTPLSQTWKDSVDARINYLRNTWGSRSSFYSYFIGHETDFWGGRYANGNPYPDTCHYKGIEYVLNRIKQLDSNPAHKTYVVHWGKRIGPPPDYQFPFGMTLPGFIQRFPNIDIYQVDDYIFTTWRQKNYTYQQNGFDSLLISYNDCMLAFKDRATEWHAVIQAQREWVNRFPTFRYRRPTLEELKIQAWLALSRGAKGVTAFVYGSTLGPPAAGQAPLAPPNPPEGYQTGQSKIAANDTIYFDGLVKTEGGGTTFQRNPFDPQNDHEQIAAFANMKSLNEELRPVGSTIRKLRVYDAFPRTAVPSDNIANIVTVSGDKVEVGVFKRVDQGSDSTVHFMLVNRVCNDSQGNVSSPQSVAVSFNFIQSKLITEIVSGKAWVVGPNGSFADVLQPGSGKLYRLEPATVAGTKTLTQLMFTNNGVLTLASNANITARGNMDTVNLILGSNATFKADTGSTMMISRDSAFVFGSGSQLRIAGALGTTNNVTLAAPSGATLRFDEQARLYCGTGSGLSISGTLIVQGTSSHRALLTRISDNDYWSGIMVNEQANVTLSHCNISHAQVGVNANTVVPTIDNATLDSCKIGVSMFLSAGTITNSTFTNNIIKGLIIDGENPYIDGPSAAPYLADNVVSSNTTGIYITNSAPILERNQISDNILNGIWCDDGGNPFISKNETDAPGNNVLENNGGASLLVDNYSFPFVGYAADENSEVYGGHNSFGPEKHEYDVWAKNESGVTARKTYWSEYPPDEATSFREDSHSWIDREFPLDSYSNRPMSGGKGSIAGSDQFHSNDPPGLSNGLGDELLQVATAHRSGSRFGRSLELIRQYIAQRPTPPQAPIALVMMYQIVLDSARAARSRDVLATFASYVDSLLDLTASERFKCALLNVRKEHLLRERNWTEAIAVAETISAGYPNSALDEHALYATFKANLFGLRNQAGALEALGRMRQLFPESPLTAHADLLIATTTLTSRGNGTSASTLAGNGVEQSVQVPVHYALYQNYPNPFNPSTTIKYDLPLDAQVTLKLYDVLGREVLTLAAGQAKAGYHSTTLDASRFSSGVYFYRIQAGQFSQTKKLILVR